MMHHTPDNEDTTDIALLVRLSSEEMAAFDCLFERHRAAVFGFVRRMVDDDEGLAEDLTQECFLRLWRGRLSWKPGPATVRTLILTIARNVALDHCKRRGVITQALQDDDAVTTPTERPEAALLGKELRSILATAQAELPDDLREAFCLREEQGLSYEEIAHILACPVGTVKSRIHAARIRLKAAGQSYWNEPLPIRHMMTVTEQRGREVRHIHRESSLKPGEASPLKSSSGYIYMIREENP